MDLVPLAWEDGVTSKQRVTWPRDYKTFSCTKFILLINVKMQTIISMINTTSERLKAKNFLFVGILAFMSI